jgi:hypothetical protein
MTHSRRYPADTGRSSLLHLAILALAVVAGCGGGGQAGEARPSERSPAAAAPTRQPAAHREYDLAADEALGGHTLKRHVGRTDAELADRLKHEPDISAASTYPDEPTARRVVAAAIEHNRGRLQTWADRSGPRPNLVLMYRDPDGKSIGRSLERNARTARPCSSARIVIRWQDRVGRWFVLTSYPEAG